jgi:hypothetical protein
VYTIGVWRYSSKRASRDKLVKALNCFWFPQ